MTLSYDKYWTIIFDKDNTIIGKINTHKEADAFCIKYPEYSWEYAKNVFMIQISLILVLMRMEFVIIVIKLKNLQWIMEQDIIRVNKNLRK